LGLSSGARGPKVRAGRGPACGRMEAAPRLEKALRHTSKWLIQPADGKWQELDAAGKLAAGAEEPGLEAGDAGAETGSRLQRHCTFVREWARQTKSDLSWLRSVAPPRHREASRAESRPNPEDSPAKAVSPAEFEELELQLAEFKARLSHLRAVHSMHAIGLGSALLPAGAGRGKSPNLGASAVGRPPRRTSPAAPQHMPTTPPRVLQWTSPAAPRHMPNTPPRAPVATAHMPMRVRSPLTSRQSLAVGCRVPQAASPPRSLPGRSVVVARWWEPASPGGPLPQAVPTKQRSVSPVDGQAPDFSSHIRWRSIRSCSPLPATAPQSPVLPATLRARVLSPPAPPASSPRDVGASSPALVAASPSVLPHTPASVPLTPQAAEKLIQRGRGFAWRHVAPHASPPPSCSPSPQRSGSQNHGSSSQAQLGWRVPQALQVRST